MLATTSYTVAEVAYMLSVPPATVRKFCTDGAIPAIKHGGTWHLPKKRFREWLDNLPEIDLTLPDQPV